MKWQFICVKQGENTAAALPIAFMEGEGRELSNSEQVNVPNVVKHFEESVHLKAAV